MAKNKKSNSVKAAPSSAVKELIDALNGDLAREYQAIIEIGRASCRERVCAIV